MLAQVVLDITYHKENQLIDEEFSQPNTELEMFSLIGNHIKSINKSFIKFNHKDIYKLVFCCVLSKSWWSRKLCERMAGKWHKCKYLVSLIAGNYSILMHNDYCNFVDYAGVGYRTVWMHTMEERWSLLYVLLYSGQQTQS